MTLLDLTALDLAGSAWFWSALLAAVGIQFTGVALVLALRYRPGAARGPVRALPTSPALPTLTLLVPCEGDEVGLEENLEAALRAPYPAPRQVLFCLPGPRDAAHAVVARALARLEQSPLAGVEARVVFSTGGLPDPNRKLQHLQAGALQASGDVIVAADSDTRLTAECLAALVTALLESEDIGLAFAPPVFPARGSSRVSLGAADGLLAFGFSSSLHAFYVLKALADFTGGSRPVVGSLLAFRRRTLETLGGYRSLAGHIGDDLELGRRVEALGLKIVASPVPVPCPHPALSSRSLFRKLHRWIVVGAAYAAWRPLTYPTLLAPLPLVMGLEALSLAIDPSRPFPVGLPSLALWVSRLVFAWTIGPLRYRRVPKPGDLWRVLVWELLLTVASVLAMFHRVVDWRGRRLLVLPGGGLLSLFDPARPGLPEIPAHPWWLGRWVLPPYTRFLVGSHLHAVWVRGLERLASCPADMPVILVPNHSCWWDGIVAYLLHLQGFRREFYLAMWDVQLRKYRFFSWAGVFSVRRGDVRAAGRLLEYCRELLGNPGRALWIFSQGEMLPEGVRPLRLESGALQVARKVGRALMVPVSLHYPLRANPRPEAFVELGEPWLLEVGASSSADPAAELERALAAGEPLPPVDPRTIALEVLTRALAQRLEAQLDGLRDALSHTPLEQVPPGFQPLLRGRRGVAETWDEIRALAKR